VLRQPSKPTGTIDENAPVLIKCPECQGDISDAAKSCPKCGHPMTPRQFVSTVQPPIARRIGESFVEAFVVLIAILAIVGFVFFFKPNGAAPPPPPPAEKTPSSNLLDDEAFLNDNPKGPATIQGLIRANGYECPRLSYLWNRGASPYGIKYEALCGPDDGSNNSYRALHYAVYVERLIVHTCKPVELFGPDCS